MSDAAIPFDPAALLAVLDIPEMAGVPPELVEQLRGLVKSFLWVPVGDRLPDPGLPVCGWAPVSARSYQTDRKGIIIANLCDETNRVSHWRPWVEFPPPTGEGTL